MPIAEKLVDALKMFWEALDQEERRVVAYLVAYGAFSVALAVQRSSAERRRTRLLAELREELTRGATAT